LPNDLPTICDLSSDYSLVILSLGGNPIQNVRPSLTDGLVKWIKFKYHWDNTINLNISLKTLDEIQNAAKFLVKPSNNQQ